MQCVFTHFMLSFSNHTMYYLKSCLSSQIFYFWLLKWKNYYSNRDLWMQLRAPSDFFLFHCIIIQRISCCSSNVLRYSERTDNRAAYSDFILCVWGVMYKMYCVIEHLYLFFIYTFCLDNVRSAVVMVQARLHLPLPLLSFIKKKTIHLFTIIWPHD